MTPTAEAVYDEVAGPVYEDVFPDRDGIKLETNECYQQNIKLNVNTAYEHVRV